MATFVVAIRRGEDDEDGLMWVVEATSHAAASDLALDELAGRGLRAASVHVMQADDTFAVYGTARPTAPEEFEAACRRCGVPNITWTAPSPLWNHVMRAKGRDLYDGIVCPGCFARLAEETGAVGGLWRLWAEDVLVPLGEVRSDGAVWNPVTWLWEQM